MNKKNNALRLAVGAIFSGGALIASSAAYSCAAEPYVGSICITAASFCPDRTHMAAQGQLLPISSYQALFSLLGNTYGGDGRTNFALPDLRSRLPLGAGKGPGLPTYMLGDMGGSVNIQIPADALPSHAHTATFNSTGTSPIEVKVPVSSKTSGNTITPDATHNYIAGTAGGPGSAAMWADGMEGNNAVNGVSATGGGATGDVTVNPAGQGAAFSHMPPVTALNYCIAVTGIYPSRP